MNYNLQILKNNFYSQCSIRHAIQINDFEYENKCLIFVAEYLSHRSELKK